MIIKQLKQLCDVNFCFLFEGEVYEQLYATAGGKRWNLKAGLKHKYRVMIREDDYDYVTDKRLVRILDRFVKSLRNE